MEAKDLILFGLLGLGAIYIAKAGFKPKIISPAGEGGFRIIPILPSFAEIGKPKEPEAPATHITYNVEVPEPSPIVFPPTPEPTPEPTPTPKPKKVYYQGRTGTWTYEPSTGILISPEGRGWCTAYPEEHIKSIEKEEPSYRDIFGITNPFEPPKKERGKKYYQGKRGTWTYDPKTKTLISPEGLGYSTAKPEETIASIEEKPKPKKKKKEVDIGAMVWEAVSTPTKFIGGLLGLW